MQIDESGEQQERWAVVAFSGCVALTAFSFPPNLQQVSDACLALRSLEIEPPRHVTCMGDLACRGCVSLTSVAFPKTVMEVHKGCMSDCVVARWLPKAADVRRAWPYGHQTHDTGLDVKDALWPSGPTRFTGDKRSQCAHMTHEIQRSATYLSNTCDMRDISSLSTLCLHFSHRTERTTTPFSFWAWKRLTCDARPESQLTLPVEKLPVCRDSMAKMRKHERSLSGTRPELARKWPVRLRLGK
jgi:hypothetical protein